MGDENEKLVTLSLTPHGVSGLKCQRVRSDNMAEKSHPTRGEWIEIMIAALTELKAERLTPHGVSGLKLGADQHL